MNDQPLIYEFIEKKINMIETISFEYSEKHDLNVALLNGEVIPFVKLAKETIAQSNLYELMTKTLEKREEEEDRDVVHLLEFLTKTKQRREEEDLSYSQNLFDLYTKTRQERESEEDSISVPQCESILFDLL